MLKPRLTLLAILVGVLLALGSGTAKAQTSIGLNGTGSGSITFTGAGAGTGGSNLTMTIVGSCFLSASTCISGAASGSGGLLSSGTFFVSGGPLTLTSLSTRSWQVSGGTLSFAYNTLSNGSGTNLLSGTLNLVNMTQQNSPFATSEFNTALVANLTGLTGTLSGVFTAAGGITNITINISGPTDLSGLGNGVPLTGNSINHGSVVPTPEPGTLVLLGSGLVAVGGFLRRRGRQT